MLVESFSVANGCFQFFTKVVLCAFAKGWWFLQKVLFSNITNWLPAPIFWPWLYVSCPKSLRGAVGDWAAGGFGCSCARSRVRGDTIQPTTRPAPAPAATAHLESSSRGNQRIWTRNLWKRGMSLHHIWGFDVKSAKAYWSSIVNTKWQSISRWNQANQEPCLKTIIQNPITIK